MPDFGNPFAGLTNDRKLTKEELIRAIRFTISAEYEAAQVYTQLAESTDDERARKVLKSITEEELVHVGEFARLLFDLDPNEAQLYLKGMNEVAPYMKEPFGLDKKERMARAIVARHIKADEEVEIPGFARLTRDQLKRSIKYRINNAKHFVEQENFKNTQHELYSSGVLEAMLKKEIELEELDIQK